MKKDFLKYRVNEEDDGAKLGSILRRNMNLSGRIITGLKKRNNIFLNGKSSFVSAIVHNGDEVVVNLFKEESQNIEPQYIPLDIAFEDEDLLIINKQPGLVVHPTKGHPDGTLSNGVIYYWREKGEGNIVRLVNRLDRDTSGLVIIAKNQFSHQALAKCLDAGTVEKTYYAVVHGFFAEEEGTIDLPIDRPTRESIRREVIESGQRAVTHYRTVERLGEDSLVELKLETGRTHQIRVHMSYLNHPIYGDTLYGETDDREFIGRQALHARRLRFKHPRTAEVIDIKAEVPEDMKLLMRKLRKESGPGI